MFKISLKTYGCRANQYDSGVLAMLAQQKQFTLVGEGEPADCYIINSCAITAQAETEARLFLNKAHRQNDQALTIVTGCSAQVSHQQYSANNRVHHVVGNNAKEQIFQIIQDHLSKQNALSSDVPPSVQDDLKNFPLFFGGGVELPQHSRSFLKIQDGCSQFCSFCIVPFARGLNQSVSPDAVMDALFELKEKGVQEVVLTGIHLGTYGKDLKPRSSLFDLLKRIDDEKPLPRVRLSSIDPEEVTEDMIDLLSSSSVFCKHMHLPLQSGDDGVLKKMRRRYDSELFENLTKKLAAKIPDLCIGTDVIVGFPGEDEAAFENTYQLIEQTPVSYVHTFPYSPRQGTKAADFSGQVDGVVKKQRSKRLRDLSAAKRQAFDHSYVGSTLEVVLENRARGWVGLTDNYISVDLEPQTHYASGSLACVTIQSMTDGCLKGAVVNS